MGKSGQGYRYEIHIPANCTAELRLPGEAVQNLCAGEFRYGD